MPAAPKLLEEASIVARLKHLVSTETLPQHQLASFTRQTRRDDRPAVLRLVTSRHDWSGGRFNGLFVLDQKDR